MRRWWLGASLRARLILIGATGVAAGLALGGLVLLQTLTYTLQRNLDSNASQTAATVVSLIKAGQLSDPIPVGAGTTAIQVVDTQGRVRAASAGSDRLVPVLRPTELALAESGSRFTISGERLAVTGPVRVVVGKAGAGTDSMTVLVAVSARGLHDSVAVVKGTLLVAFPLLVAALAVLAWRVVGWTLRPVESLRRGAAEITGARTGGRLPVPSGKDEVHRLAVTLNDMLARLDAARQRQRAFVADAAHEFRSPLASMRTQLEVSSRLGPDAVDWSDVARDLQVEVDRLARLTDDLLLLARADEGALAPPAVDVDLAGVVREVVGRYADARVPVTSSSEGEWQVEGTPDALRRVVANLVDNAVRHARSCVVVAVSGTCTDGGRREVLLTVTDDGPGIPPEDRMRVFDRFTRLDDARARDDGGSGLGLAIVRELVRLHRGSVVLADAAPGVRAEVRLPVASRSG
ncbi:sensor histidine kinase [Actinopolymorpha alba]|uniref:sensor histidine kinase n=1 Tax=Actinopolymorpha alba TaxID=533267 RepID=UPI00036EF6BA|nr:ATP-binding protein [Actinopolymorpha alba]